MNEEGFVYLRPNALNAPKTYIESIEKAGLMVYPEMALGIYTCSTSPASGPPGPIGEPYLNDTIIASCSDEWSNLEVDLVNPAVTFRAAFALELDYIRLSLTTAPEGADVIVDVHLDDVSIFAGSPANLIHVDANSKTSVGSATPYVLSIATVPDDGEFKVYITQVGTIGTGTGLKISVTGAKQDSA